MNPEITARYNEDKDFDVRNEKTEKIYEKTKSINGFCIGKFNLKVFRTTREYCGDGDRYGTVLQINVKNDTGMMTPTTKNTKNGIEICFPGEEESRYLLPMIEQALQEIKT